MKKFFALVLVLALLPLSLITANAAGNDCSIKVSAPANVVEGQKFEVVMTIDDMASGKNASLVCFCLNFDPDLVTPDYTQSITGDATRILEAPGEWEHMIKLESGYYDCAFNPDDGGLYIDGQGQKQITESCLSNGDTLTVSLPFVAKEGAAGETAAFTLSNIEIYDAYDDSLSTLLSAGANSVNVAVNENVLPVKTLGAKINTQYPSLRLGATYDRSKLANRSLEVSDITDVGIVFCPARFVTDELTKETSGAVAMSAIGIEEYDANKTFADYESFTFYVTIVAVPVKGYDTMIAFRGFFSTEDGDFYAVDTLERSYQYVLDVVFGTSVAGDDNVSHEKGDNVIITPTNWWDD